MKQLGFTHESQHNESKEWYTPPYIFEALGLRFDTDPASPGKEFVPWIPVARHITRQENGLITPWTGRVWLNPPYGQDTPKWVRLFADYPDGIMIVFARTDTRWFHDYATKCDAMLFIRSRVKFIRADGKRGQGAGAGSMLLANGRECVQAICASGLGFPVMRSASFSIPYSMPAVHLTSV